MIGVKTYIFHKCWCLFDAGNKPRSWEENQTKVREKYVSIQGWVVNFSKMPENQPKIHRNR